MPQFSLAPVKSSKRVLLAIALFNCLHLSLVLRLSCKSEKKSTKLENIVDN